MPYSFGEGKRFIMPDKHNATKINLRSLRSNAFNLQTMLRLASDNRQSSIAILDKICQTIQNQFDRIEALDINIPEENKQDHRALMEYCRFAEAKWQKGKISDSDYAETLNFKLYNHFSMYFKPLLEAHLEEGTLLKFRL